MDYTQEQLRQIFLGLPESVQDVMVGFDTIEALQKIYTKHNLHVDQADELARQTGYIMLGITEPHDFARTLSKNMGLTDSKAQEIVNDINDQIFLPIQEELKKSKEVKEKVLLSEAEEISKIKEGMGLDVMIGAYQGKPEDAQKPEVVTPLPAAKPESTKTNVASTTPANLPRDIFQERLGNLFRAPLPNNRQSPPLGQEPKTSTDLYREPPV